MDRLKELRKEKNLSQGLLAEIFGVISRTLQRWECGESQIRTNKIKQFVNYFGVIEGYLLGYVDNCLDDNQKETGHTEEAPRYVKNILARLRELPPNDREVWLKAIIGEFEQDFSHAKWREGYEQGKLEGAIEREKVVLPQFVADWIDDKSGLFGLNYDSASDELYDWVYANEENIKKLHLAFVRGYEIKKEKRYRVSMLNTRNYKNHAQLLCEVNNE